MTIPISTVEQLQAMRDDLREHYVLINDIDASDTANWNGGLGFEPVGTFDEVGSRETGFEGVLDGRGHTIHGLHINRPTESHVGLFGVVRQHPDSVDEVSIRDVRISGASIRGNTYVGTLAGRFGVANYRGSRVRMLRCAADGVVTGNSIIGGMCGWVDQRTLAEGMGFEDCISRVDVIHEGASGNSGGFLSGYYNKSYRCLSTGEVLWTGNGGFQAPSGSPPSTIVEACFWDIESSGQAASHSIPGAAATGLISSEAKSISTYTDAGWDIAPRKSKDHVWGIHPSINDGYPFLQVFNGDPIPGLIGGEIAYWKCDEGDGDVLLDSVGGFDGVISGPDVTWQPNPGTTKFRNPYYASFGGSRPRVIVPTPILTPTQTSTAWSCTAWVYPMAVGSGPNWSIMGAAGPSATTRGTWTLRLNIDRHLEFFLNHPGNTFRTVPEAFPEEVWSHVGCTYDGATLKIYHNGEEKLSVLQQFDSVVPGQFWIGDRSSSSYASWSGGLDELRVFSRTLSQDEMSSLAAGGPNPRRYDPFRSHAFRSPRFGGST